MSEVEERIVLAGSPARERARLADAPSTPLDGRAWLRALGSSDRGAGDATLEGWADGNRGAVLDTDRVEHRGRSWLLSVKGVGARAPLYGSSPIEFGHARELDPSSPDGERPLLGAITREGWMNEAPYGAQGAANAEHAMHLSSAAMSEALYPAMLCPTIAVLEVPEREIIDASYYRRYPGAVLQEHRLVPSMIRLFHQSSLALGRNVDGALAALGVESAEALDAFLDAFLRSAMGLLTVAARSARVRADGFVEVLDYDDAWLDKDAVVAPDGTLFFADLEALAYVVPHDAAALEERIRRQVERNAYEVLYAAHALLLVEERWRSRPRDQSSRRRVLAERSALSLSGCASLGLERGEGGWDLLVRSPLGGDRALRWIDER